MTPSMIAWATWTPFGAYSLAIEKANARLANFAVAKPDINAFDFTDAVAPVKMRVGG